jgi:hypothetical protein
MGLFKPFTCDYSQNRYIFRVLYLSLAATLITIGILIETDTLDSPFEDEYWYVSLALLPCIAIFLLFLLPRLLSDPDEFSKGEWQAAAWGTSHFLFYFVLTFLAPKQWPFWLGAGVLWESYECWTKCISKHKICSGFFDIMINTAGVSSALAIRMGLFNKGEILEI